MRGEGWAQSSYTMLQVNWFCHAYTPSYSCAHICFGFVITILNYIIYTCRNARLLIMRNKSRDPDKINQQRGFGSSLAMAPIHLRQDTSVARVPATSAASICQPLPGLFASRTAYQEELFAGHPWPHGTGESCRGECCMLWFGLSNVVKTPENEDHHTKIYNL